MSRIEQIIDDIEQYIDDCKPSAFSSTKIVVNKEEMLELLTELRQQIPDEVKQYQKIISNQEAIINQARNQADGMIQEANKEREQMVDEHEIMQKAYANANAVIEDAHSQADMIVNNAKLDAENLKRSIMQYSDDVLAELQSMIKEMLDETKSKYGNFESGLKNNFEMISENRKAIVAVNKDKE